MKYYLYSLEHRKILDDIGEPQLVVLSGGSYRPFTSIVNDPAVYNYSDYKIVAICDNNKRLRVRRLGSHNG